MACKCKTEVYSRVVGYYRPVQQWNKGKKAEYFDRNGFRINLAEFNPVRLEGNERLLDQTQTKEK